MRRVTGPLLSTSLGMEAAIVYLYGQDLTLGLQLLATRMTTQRHMTVRQLDEGKPCLSPSLAQIVV